VKLKVMTAEGTKPPAIGIWWHGAQYKDHAHEVLRLIQKQRLPEIDYDLAYSDYAADLQVWQQTKVPYDDWYRRHWGEEYTAPALFWGITYDTDPEMNEFGEVSP
jgi:hypothetical protein